MTLIHYAEWFGFTTKSSWEESAKKINPHTLEILRYRSYGRDIIGFVDLACEICIMICISRWGGTSSGGPWGWWV